MVVNCEQVWREISNYVDNELDPALRAAIEEHIRNCKKCKAVLDGTRNVVRLYGDERMSGVPLGFDRRLRRRLEENMNSRRRVLVGWLVAAASAIAVGAAFGVGNLSVFRSSGLRSEHARRGTGIPPALAVIVAEDGKTFHVAGCPFIHDKAHLRTVSATEAIREGYAPCVRCLKNYLSETSASGSGGGGQNLADLDDTAPR